MMEHKSEDKMIVSRKNKKVDPYTIRILEAARQLFTESGLEAVNMYQIAQKAGIGQGSLYRRYSDKGAICSDLLGNRSESFLTELEFNVLKSPSSASSLELLESCIEKVIDFIDEHADLLHLIKSEFVGKGQLTQFEHPIFQSLNAIVVKLLDQASNAEEIIPIDTQFTATALISALSPDVYLYQQKVYGSSKQQITAGIVTLFITGLRKKS
ncbi:TetR/AcrR family transcriptional regulator [Paenibacillus pini]|uniref:Transcriptional regulator n=2 Tax=Paenibacillus TaxID=44249 RepID=W7YZD6_9BACL|nr:transcriptional regulator [Paenibacillus pini JCM 16418]